MQKKADDELGSWSRAVATSNGVWHTRGHFSKNGSFIVKNYMNGELLWYAHKCMRGKEKVVSKALFEVTSKSMEGIMSDECYERAKEEGCKVEVVWQDGDSSAAKSVKKHHLEGKVCKCGGHVGRAHVNQLKEAAKKDFTEGIKAKYRAKFHEVTSSKCICVRHRQDVDVCPTAL